MYKTIVVGTDGSQTADVALTRAAELARATGATLHVVSAHTPSAAHAIGGAHSEGYTVPPDFRVDAVLERAIDRLRGEGVEVEPHGPKGDPADALVEIASRESADLIVLGSVGMQGARRILGSVPNKVSHRSPCDVLIVQTS
jgi:nucleotide-binding universal stress UspA family protein